MLFITLLATLPFLASARTDLVGCTSSVSGPSLIWYVPDTGELCDFLDCGGGRAPPKTTVPGCAAYSGTATYSPSYLPGWGPNGRSTSTEAPATPATPATSTTVASDINSINSITSLPTPLITNAVASASNATRSTATVTAASVTTNAADRKGLSVVLIGAGLVAAVL